jgi:hypothetical protein
MTSTDYHGKAKLLFAAVLCVAALAAGLYYRHYSAQYTTYRVETHDPVSGLIVDSPVEFHGVEVGNVTKIELTDPRTVSILLRVAKTHRSGRRRWPRSPRAAWPPRDSPVTSTSLWKIRLRSPAR